jgi:hypothetical protein
MALTGNLEDVSLPEILQLVHLTRRSGRLSIEQYGRSGHIDFAQGRVVGARSPGSVFDEPDAVDGISVAIRELVLWTHGSFELIAMPAGASPPADEDGIDTQMLLLDALRILDERKAKGEVPQIRSRRGPATTAVPAASEGRATPPAPASSKGASESAATLRVLSSDTRLAEGIAKDLKALGLPASIEDAAAALSRTSARDGDPLIVDVRRLKTGLAVIRRIRGRFPTSPLAIVADPRTLSTPYYEEGVCAVLPASRTAVRSWVRNLGVLSAASARLPATVRKAPVLEKLWRAFGDLRSGLLSATVSLHLMNVLAEAADRGVLFIVRGDRALAIGAFGQDPDGKPLASVTHKLQLPVGGEDGISRCIASSRPESVRLDLGELPEALIGRIGAPASKSATLIPVLGRRETNLLIYADNGQDPDAVGDLRLIELVAAQVGLAFENEMLHRRVAALNAA